MCGEASSVCGTITINKRKVGFPFKVKEQLFGQQKSYSVSIFVLFLDTVWGDEQWAGGEQRAGGKSSHRAAEARARPAKCSAGERQHEGAHTERSIALTFVLVACDSWALLKSTFMKPNNQTANLPSCKNAFYLKLIKNEWIHMSVTEMKSVFTPESFWWTSKMWWKLFIS